MKKFLFLRILDRFRRGFESIGCDYPVMRKILEMKLAMDGRRVPTILNRGGRKRRSTDQNNYFASLWIYLLMGMMIVPFVMKQTYLFQMSIAFAILMFFVTLSMIADFSSVLLDLRDRVVFLTKPVNAKTVSVARVLHIILYLAQLTAVLAGPGIVAGALSHGWWFTAAFVVGLVLMDLFIVAVTALLYLTVLNVFDGERLKDFVNYVQIGLSIAMAVGYQLVGRSFSVLKLHWVFHAAWWQVVIPPVWFGAAFAWLAGQQSGAPMGVLAVLALLFPLGLFYLYVRLMPNFERHLQKLSKTAVSQKSAGRSWRKAMARILCRRPDERTVFEFASVMMSRERDFKLKVYPTLGFAIIFPFMVLFNPAFAGMGPSHWYLAIYMSAMMIPTAVMMLGYSGQHKAAWIYKTLPLQDPVDIFRGTIKAFLARLFLPVFLADSLIFVILSGPRVLPNLGVAFLSLLVYTIVSFRFLKKRLPFSEPFQTTQQTQGKVIMLLMLVLFLFAGIHYVFSLWPFGIFVYLIILLAANGILWRVGFRLNDVVLSR